MGWQNSSVTRALWDSRIAQRLKHYRIVARVQFPAVDFSLADYTHLERRWAPPSRHKPIETIRGIWTNTASSALKSPPPRSRRSWVRWSTTSGPASTSRLIKWGFLWFQAKIKMWEVHTHNRARHDRDMNPGSQLPQIWSNLSDKQPQKKGEWSHKLVSFFGTNYEIPSITFGLIQFHSMDHGTED